MRGVPGEGGGGTRRGGVRAKCRTHTKTFEILKTDPLYAQRHQKFSNFQNGQHHTIDKSHHDTLNRADKRGTLDICLNRCPTGS